MENKKIYIVLTRTNTILSRLIGFVKDDEYTHASISLDSGLREMYSFGRKYTYNPFVGRFVKENFNKGVYGRHNNLYGLIMEIEVSQEQYQKAENLINEFILNKDLYKYNYIGLVNCLLNIESCNNKRFLCSEFVYYILIISNIVDLKKSRNLVRPQDLLNIKGRVVFSGNLKKAKWLGKTYNEDEFLPKYQYAEI
ncbi:hypothetical protein J2Z76_000989 [Sedimentibacter acidaminivorans]|uniref:Uncharacterized protein n=1 Tax=Sedimentibacter acidaminivorans TaxID=913099 RepID=A0ABS4GBS8_9FIRM|nr:hypothetical protein [Sedimentibacter acidaminivorans]MBP1925132.1 hypothetical protein [Sedimentibacter acidaminivorans]